MGAAARGRVGAPTGIARVELAYVQHFLYRDDTLFVRTTPRLGPRLVPRARVSDTMRAIESAWSERADPHGELDAIERRLASTFGVPGARAARDGGETAPGRSFARGRRAFGGLGELLRPSGRPDGEVTASRNAVYFHVSHQATDEPHRFRWLEGTAMRKVFACHDLIPVTHPEYVQPGAAQKHRRRIETVTRLADLVVVISHATRRDLLAHVERHGLRRPPIVVAPLGVEPVWSREPDAPQAAFSAPVPFFLCVGTIEARKNHAFLFTLWRELVARHGRAAPLLLVVGKRGWQVETATNLLERSTGFDGHVHELGMISDAALAILLRQAAGLLSPSFAEGFSYPPIEAMLAGCPVVASDIGAHREYLDGVARFLSPVDGEGWMAAVLELASHRAPPPPPRSARGPNGSAGPPISKRCLPLWTRWNP